MSSNLTLSAIKMLKHTFSTKHGNLRFLDVGTGSPLVFCHGTPSSGSEVVDCVRELERLGVPARLLALDHLGVGESEKPPQAPYTPCRGERA